MKELKLVAQIAACLAVLVLLPAVVRAQGGADTPTPLGRQGALWDSDMQIAKAQLAEFEAGLAALTLDEWREQAVAWAEVATRLEEREIDIPVSFHVLNVDAGKRAEVELDPLDEGWYIAFGTKAPKEIDLILSDKSSTRVSCSLADLPPLAEGLFGVFVLETRVFCYYRPAEEGEPS
jgi:hypothetical protein